MKTLKNLSLFAIVAIATLFVSCFNLSGGNTASNETVTLNKKNKREITITISNYDELLMEAASNGRSATSNARTIVEEGYAPAGLDFYIIGNSSNDEKLTVAKIDPYAWDGNKGRVSLALNAYSWDLTLYAVEKPESDGALKNKTGTKTFKGTSTSIADDEEVVKDNAVLAGTTSIDMYYTSDAYFTLSPNGLGKDQLVNLTLKLGTDWEADNVPDGYKVTAGLYDLITGQVITNSANNPMTQTYDSEADKLSKETGKDFTGGTKAKEEGEGGAAAVTVKTGTYNFVVTFTNEQLNKVFVWSDVLIVLPGKGCTTNVTIPNVIGKLPTVPASFKTGYVAGKEDEVEDMYEVMFEWQDSSNNETYFEIQMVDTSILFMADDTATGSNDGTNDYMLFNLVKGTPANGDTPATPDTKALKTKYSSWSAWTDASKFGWDKIKEAYDKNLTWPDFVRRYGVDFYGMDCHKSGSLNANNTEASFYLPLGSSYKAMIYAVNDAGYSVTGKEVDLTTAPAGSVAFDGGTNAYGKKENGTAADNAETPTKYGTDASYVARKNAAKTINRFRLTYDLQGGTFDPDGNTASGQPTQEGKIIEYYCQDATTGNFVLYPNAVHSDTEDAYLQRGTTFFDRWATNINTAAAVLYATTYDAEKGYVPDMYKGTANLTLYALYGGVGVEVIDPYDLAILPTWIKWGYDDSGDAEKATNAVTGNSAAITLDKKDGDAVVWAIKMVAVGDGDDAKLPDFNYDSIGIKVYKGKTTYYEKTLTTVAAKGSANVFTVPLKDLPVGVYQMIIKATYCGTTVSYPLSLNVVKS